MKDQVAVLRWIKKNIRDFGGDPNRVTIFGDSAGGASVHLHMYSPLSAGQYNTTLSLPFQMLTIFVYNIGLFHRAISQSGSALVPWAVVPPEMSKNRTFSLAILTGCPLSSTENLVSCLKKLSAENVAGQLPKFFVSWQHRLKSLRSK